MFKKSIEAILTLERHYIVESRANTHVESIVKESFENNESEDIDYRGISIEPIPLDEAKKTTRIYGLDSSSRVVDTPYSFIAVGASTVLNRFTGLAIDYPSVRDIYGEDSRKRFVLFIPKFEASEHELDMLEETNIITRSPGGYRYRAGYDKLMALDELRLLLENAVLEELLLSDNTRDSILLLDGPIYLIPRHLHFNSRDNMDELQKAYIDAWFTIVSKRLELLRRLQREKDFIVIGIVKRIDKSNLISKKDPFNITKGCLNDLTYLSLLVEKQKFSNDTHPVKIGPLSCRPLSFKIDLPVKRAYYIGVPKVPRGDGSRFYVFFRIETLDCYDEKEVIDPVIYDSVLSGATLPLTILIADNRVKKITDCLIRYMKALLEIPLETTSDYITE